MLALLLKPDVLVRQHLLQELQILPGLIRRHQPLSHQLPLHPQQRVQLSRIGRLAQ